MRNMCTLVHNDYDRIIDKVMWLGYGATLNFGVDLYYQRKDGLTKEKNKENFHREILYKTDSNDIRVKITRDFTYYFSIDYNIKDNKTRVTIGPEHIYFLIFNLKKVLQWFIGENGINTIFSKKSDGSLFIPTYPEPIKVNLAYTNYIEFEPAINNVNGYDVIGVKTYLNNDGTFFFMTSDIVFSLVHMLSTCNMYSLAQNMLNYIGRPEYGTNLFDMQQQTTYQNNRASFFDRVGAKSN